MEKKLQIFVSSTFEDLKAERQKAVEGILRAGHIPAGMELFTAGSTRQWDVIEDWIKESDILMLILGGRYGSIEPTTGLSYTEMEYQFALENNIPVFAVVLNDQFLANKKSFDVKLEVYEKNEVEKYDDFKRTVTSNLVRFVSNIDQIQSEVSFSLNTFMKQDVSKHKFRGWVRPSNLVTIPSKESNTAASGVPIGDSGNKLFERDSELLTRVINVFEDENIIGTISYISTYCFYQRPMVDPIFNLLEFSKLPTTRFFNDEVQRLFDVVMKSIYDFANFLSLNFFTKRGAQSNDMYLYPDLNPDYNHIEDHVQGRYERYLDQLSLVAFDAQKQIKSFIFESQKALYNN
ncbi:DUF4062 domain-containing protein [Priestia megaterium]